MLLACINRASGYLPQVLPLAFHFISPLLVQTPKPRELPRLAHFAETHATQTTELARHDDTDWHWRILVA